MMKILTRYVLSLFFTIFLISLTVMSSIVILYLISEASIKKGLPLYLALKLIPCSMPYLLSLTLPVATLLGATLSFAKIVGSNEIIALKAMGVPPWRAFLPVWIVSFFLSLLAIWCNDVSFSWGDRKTTELIISGTEEMILGKLAADGKFADPDGNFVLKAASVTKNGELQQISFQISDPPFKGEAESGRLSVDLNSEPRILRVETYDLYAKSEEGQGEGIWPGKKVQEVSLENFLTRSFSAGDPALREVKPRLETIKNEQAQVRRKIAAKIAFAMVRGNFSLYENQELRNLWDQEEYLQYRYYRFKLAPHRYISAGFTCFFFAWVGVPLAVWLNRSDYITSFFACFLPTLVIYYPILMFGYSAAKSGLLPPSICWSANLVLGLIGVWILKKIHRH